MSILNKYNKKPLFEYDNNKEHTFMKLKELVDKYGIDREYTVHALFINTKSKFGNAPIVVTDDYMVNAPHHLLDIVEEMREDEEVINLVNARKVDFKIYAYQGRNGNGYSIEWIEK